MEWLTWWSEADWIVRGVFIALGALSVLSWSIILYKAVYFAGVFKAERTGGGGAPVQDWLRALPAGAPSSRVSRLIAGAGPDREGLRLRADGAVRGVRLDLESGLTLLATIGNTAPFIGLFGTVWGIMHALQGLSGEAALTMDMVAGPVAEALVATAAGLFAAIPAVVGYNLLLRQLRRICGQIETNALSLVETMAARTAEER